MLRHGKVDLVGYILKPKKSITQVKQLIEKGGKFGPHFLVEVEYLDDFDLMMQLFGYTQNEDGYYRPGTKMIGRK